MSFEMINNYTKIYMKITTKSKVMIGSGNNSIPISDQHIMKLNLLKMTPELLQRESDKKFKDMVPMDLPMVYEGKETKYIIPGSTLKGHCRSRVELYSDQSCFSISNGKLDDKTYTHQNLFGVDRSVRQKFSCWICNIFGSIKDGKSKIRFSDAVLTSKSQPPQANKLRTMGNAWKLLFEKNSVFYFTIHLINQSEKVEADILTALGALNNDTRLMGFGKYRQQVIENQDEDFGIVKFGIRAIRRYYPNEMGILTEKNIFTGVDKKKRGIHLGDITKQYLLKLKKIDTRVKSQDEDSELIRKSPSSGNKRYNYKKRW